MIPIPEPTALLSKDAVASGAATNVTPAGTPEIAVVLKPVRTALFVPSKVLLAVGKSSIRCVIAAPSVNVNLVEKSVGAE